MFPRIEPGEKQAGGRRTGRRKENTEQKIKILIKINDNKFLKHIQIAMTRY